ncbi:MAG: SDR family oxidoreductase [Clostridiales bacterium]|nr:SDR family oxidoreductase [Clostridiales bacterium]
MSKKIAVVTGASRGIGLEIARQLLKENYKVYGLCRHPLEKERRICWLSCDVSVKTSVDQAFARILAREKRIDVLINNAGMGISGAVEFLDEQDILRQLTVNLEGAVWCTQAVIPSMRAAGGGKIIFISSLGAIFPLPYQSFYSVSKAGMNVFCDALGIELAPFHIQTCTVMLNDVKTEFTEHRKKNIVGDSIYGGRIKASVAKMEASEQSGMSPDKVACLTVRLIRKKHMPAHFVAGFFNKILVLLYRLLPTGQMLKILGKIYG